jgi:hypothetical protein
LTEPDVEINTRLRSETLVAHVPPEARTEVEGDRVTLAREQTRRGVPEHMESGVHYRDVLIDKRLTGEKDADASESELHAAAKRASVSRGRMRELAQRGSGQTGPESAEPREERDNVSDDTSAMVKRRIERDKRREVRAKSGQRSDETSSPRENGGSPEVSRNPGSTGELIADFLNRTPLAAVLGAGAVVGAAAGAVTAAKVPRNQKDRIAGEVKVDLLNKIELLTIRLRLHRASD